MLACRHIRDYEVGRSAYGNDYCADGLNQKKWRVVKSHLYRMWHSRRIRVGASSSSVQWLWSSQSALTAHVPIGHYLVSNVTTHGGQINPLVPGSYCLPRIISGTLGTMGIPHLTATPTLSFYGSLETNLSEIGLYCAAWCIKNANPPFPLLVRSSLNTL